MVCERLTLGAGFDRRTAMAVFADKASHQRLRRRTGAVGPGTQCGIRRLKVPVLPANVSFFPIRELKTPFLRQFDRFDIGMSFAGRCPSKSRALAADHSGAKGEGFGVGHGHSNWSFQDL